VAYGSATAGAQRAVTGQSEPCEDIFSEPVFLFVYPVESGGAG
jgi:hypothetical protein